MSEADNFENPSLKVLEIELTQGQFKALQRLLPKGYSLEIITRKRETTPKPSKKVFTNEGNAVKRNQTADSEVSDSSNKRSLREQRKPKKAHLEQKYADFEPLPTTSSKAFKPSNEGVRKCYNLLQRLKKHPCAFPFLQPVDVEGLGLHDYYDIILEPMDLGTVETKLKNGEYSSVNQFAADIRKIWNNAFRYNAKGTEIYQMTSEMSSYFEKLFKEIEHVSFNDTIRDLEKKVEKLSRQISDFHYRGGKHASVGNSRSNKPSSNLDKPMTIQEKRILGQNIRSLPPEYLRGVWDIVSEGLPYNQQNKEELEFDIDTLPVRITRELERYVKSKMSMLNKNQSKKKGGHMIPKLPDTPTKKGSDV